ncbi:MAG: hypothetical protein Q9177_001227 [Variospora cf. flavescens]
MFVHSENSNNARLHLDHLQNPPSVPPQGYSQTLRSKTQAYFHSQPSAGALQSKFVR